MIDTHRADTKNLGVWRTFHPSHQKRDKWQALKVLEEASETVHAAERLNKYVEWGFDKQFEQSFAATRADFILEIADLLQTVANLMAAYDISEKELSVARYDINKKNRRRGMFQDGTRTHMHREEEEADADE